MNISFVTCYILILNTYIDTNIMHIIIIYFTRNFYMSERHAYWLVTDLFGLAFVAFLRNFTNHEIVPQ